MSWTCEDADSRIYPLSTLSRQVAAPPGLTCSIVSYLSLIALNLTSLPPPPRGSSGLLPPQPMTISRLSLKEVAIGTTVSIDAFGKK